MSDEPRRLGIGSVLVSDEPQPLKRRPSAYRRPPDQIAAEARAIVGRMNHDSFNSEGHCTWCEEEWPCDTATYGQVIELLANEVHRLGVKAGEIA